MSTAKTSTKVFQFTGIVCSYTPVENSTDRLVMFDTLNAAKTRPIKFFAKCTDTDLYLASYIKSHAVVHVEVKEIEPEKDKRRFEIINMMSDKELANFNALKAYEEQVKVQEAVE